MRYFVLGMGLVVMVMGHAMAKDPITVVSWGGAYTKSQIEAYHKPWIAEGNQLISEDFDGNVAPIKAQVQSGNVTWDVVDVEMSDAIRLCDEGLLEELPTNTLPKGQDGTSASQDFVDGALGDCWVANIVWSTVYAYNTETFSGNAPSTIADFFDVDTFPGKRGLRKTAKATLEIALMADGVPAQDVYEHLGTEAGLNRAFAKLDAIRDHIVWWEAGAQPPQLLADGEVAMTTAYNGRIFNAQIAEGKPFAIIWDGQLLDFDAFVIPKGTKNFDQAWDFVKASTTTKALADQASWISYGPARKSSAPFVGLYHDGKTEMAPHMPTSPGALKNAVSVSHLFWADYTDQLNERFNAWLAR